MSMNRMKLKFLLALLLTSIVQLNAQEMEATVVSVSDTSRLENALLWKISRSDIEDTSYLFGTIHLIDSDDFFLPEGTEQALDKSKMVVFEIDIAEMMDISAQLSLLMRAFMDDGTQLSDLVSSDDYALIEKHFEEMGLPMFMLDRIKPMFLSVFASGDMSPDGLSSGDMMSYEMEFYDIALKEKKPTGGLETIEFQLSVFDSIPYEDQAEMLVASIKSTDDEDDVFDQMIDLYLSQDIDSLYSMVGDEEFGAGEYEDVLIKDRNERWISGITGFMTEGSVFFAVGAGHLGGPDGVIRLLRQNSFTVVPVSHRAVHN